MHTALSGASESHEATPDRNHKLYWREPLVKSVSLIDTVFFNLVASDDVNDTSIKKSSLFDSEKPRTSLSNNRCHNDPPNTESVVAEASSHRELYPSDERGVAYMYPQSDVGCNRTR